MDWHISTRRRLGCAAKETGDAPTNLRVKRAAGRESYPMKRTAIAALLAVACALAVPALASADVNVNDDGVGFVGKGDVQTALGVNDAEVQSLFEGESLQFHMGVVKTYDNYWACSDGSVHPYTTIVRSNRPVQATAHTNNAGKLTSGWDLGGFYGTTHSASEDILTEPWGICNVHGSYITDVRINDDLHSTTTSILRVAGWAELPNTPVEA
jgi:hypothetical protein